MQHIIKHLFKKEIHFCRFCRFLISITNKARSCISRSVSYTPHDGDASIIAETYLNLQTGKPFAASFIPLVAFSESYTNPCKGSWQALPIFKALRGPKWVADTKSNISKDYMK